MSEKTVNKIRVGEEEYDIRDSSVGGQVQVLEDELDDLKSAIDDLSSETATLATRTFTGGGYRNNGAGGDFSYQTSTEYYTSQLIPLNGETKVKVRQYKPMRGSGWSVINFFNSNEEVISNQNNSNTSADSDYTDNEYNVPSGASYVSYLTHSTFRAEARLLLNSGETSIANRIERIESVLQKEETVDIGTPTAGVFYRDGGILDSSAYSITDYIPCNLGDSFKVTSYGVGAAWQWQVAYYDENKSQLTFWYKGTGTSEEKTINVEVPYTNCKYIRVSFSASRGVTVKKIIMAEPGALEEIENDITEIEEDVEELKNKEIAPLNIPMLQARTFTGGGYRKTSSSGGSFVWENSTLWYTSNKMELGDETQIKVRQYRPAGSATTPTANGWSVVNFFDASDNVISNQISNSGSESSDYEDITYAVPSGAKYVSFITGSNYRAEAQAFVENQTIAIDDRVEAIETEILNETRIRVRNTSTGVFYRDGDILESSAYEITDYLPCEYGDQFKVTSYGVGSAWQWQVAYYDEAKSLLNFGYKGTGTTELKTINVEVPYANCKYVKIAYSKSGGIELSKLSPKKESIPSVIELNKQSLDDALGAGINKGRFTGSSNPDSFMLLHFSDIHGTAMNLKDISSVQKYLVDVLDDTLCTGDIMASNWSNDYTFWDANSDGSILTCIGNHDVKAQNAGGTGYLTNQETESTLYGRYMEDYISGWDVEHSDTNLYYYKDYATKKIRLIVLNLLYPTLEKVTEQNTWLASALAGAKSAGYGVVIGEHYYPVSGTKISCTFSAEVNFPTAMSNPENYMYNGDALTTYQATVQSFIDGGGNFVCWLCGHKHADYIVYHPTYPKQVFIGVGGALFTDWSNELNHTSDMRRVRGTRSQNCMNVLSIDPTDKKIKIIRIGCDRDYLGRHRGALTLDYSTSPATVVYND